MLIVTRKLASRTEDIRKSQIIVTHGGEQLVVTMRSGKSNAISIGLHGPESFKIDRAERKKSAVESDESPLEEPKARLSYAATDSMFDQQRDCFVRIEGSFWMSGKVKQVYTFGENKYYNVETSDGQQVNGLLAEDVVPIIDSSGLIPTGLETRSTSV